MAERKLDCCVVRDLLPAYIEELTEEDTACQVMEHLEGCPDCRQMETDMRAQVPVEKAPKGALNFLKRVKRTRLLAAAVTVLLTLWCVCWLYGQEYCWQEDEASMLLALQEEVGWIDRMEGAKFRIIDILEENGNLVVAYAAEGTDDNNHGVAFFERGNNGKYAFVGDNHGPMPFTNGIYMEQTNREKDWERTYLMVGDGCREIYSVRIDFDITDERGIVLRQEPVTFPVEEMDFIRIIHTEQVPHGEKEIVWLSYPEDIAMLDKDGNDVTDQYRLEGFNANWGGSIGVAEREMVYALMAIVGIFGAVVVRYFLRRD